MTAHDLLKIIEHKHGDEEINEAHAKLEEKIDGMTDSEKKAMLILLVYTVDAFRNM